MSQHLGSDLESDLRALIARADAGKTADKLTKGARARRT
jgi:hypothetical protein